MQHSSWNTNGQYFHRSIAGATTILPNKICFEQKFKIKTNAKKATNKKQPQKELYFFVDSLPYSLQSMYIILPCEWCGCATWEILVMISYSVRRVSKDCSLRWQRRGLNEHITSHQFHRSKCIKWNDEPRYGLGRSKHVISSRYPYHNWHNVDVRI